MKEFIDAFTNLAKRIKVAQTVIMYEAKILQELTAAQNKLIDESVLVPGTYDVDNGFVLIINTDEKMVAEFFTYEKDKE